jgi:hypothetical protein
MAYTSPLLPYVNIGPPGWMDARYNYTTCTHDRQALGVLMPVHPQWRATPPTHRSLADHGPVTGL